jgi:Protein of unknown function (DUF1838)
MDRRAFLVAGATASGLALGSGGAAAQTSNQTSKIRSGPVERDLKGKFLDLTSQEGNREAWARLLGNTDMKSTKYGWAEGIVQGVRPGEAVRDLVGFTMISAARLLPHEDGVGYRKVLREIGLYTDLETGEIITEWRNPYLNETVKVVPIANDPFNHTITNFYPEPPRYGGLNQDRPPPRPLLLDWRRRDDTLNLFSHINLFYPSALQPEKWPRESSGPFNQVTETFLYQIDWNDMQNPQLTSVEYNGTWARTTPWLPWMLMGPTPGHCQYQTFMGAVDSLDKINPRTVAYVRQNYPKYLEAPERWEEPSLSSLERYAREQKPAPLPADGNVPVAPAPELPEWFRRMQQARKPAS